MELMVATEVTVLLAVLELVEAEAVLAAMVAEVGYWDSFART